MAPRSIDIPAELFYGLVFLLQKAEESAGFPVGENLIVDRHGFRAHRSYLFGFLVPDLFGL
jgi:hypothetical protein